MRNERERVTKGASPISFSGHDGWWRDPGARIDRIRTGQARRPDGSQVVLAPESRGTLIGALVAAEASVGLVELRKELGRISDTDAWLVARKRRHQVGSILPHRRWKMLRAHLPGGVWKASTS